MSMKIFLPYGPMLTKTHPPPPHTHTKKKKAVLLKKKYGLKKWWIDTLLQNFGVHSLDAFHENGFYGPTTGTSTDGRMTPTSYRKSTVQ